MKHIGILLLSLITSLYAEEITLYATLGMVSHHFEEDENDRRYNENHRALGAEALWDHRYTLAYLHFTNSRNKSTEITAVGYRHDLYGRFGVYGVVGYQKGYCFEGFKSVECTEGKDNDGIAFLPMVYYRHPYFMIDFMTQGSMVAFKLNLKLF